MDPCYFEKLAPPHAPASWLAVMSPGKEDRVVAVAANQWELRLADLKKRCMAWIQLGHRIVPMPDAPSLKVVFSSGLFSCGYIEVSPAHLSARKNWFLRYRHILEPHLRDPLPALVFCYEPRPLEDFLCTMRSTRDGPFPFPKNADWPRCGYCNEPMAFIGVLDFREYHRVGRGQVPVGSLVLHGCDQCTIPCSDPESTALTWITTSDDLQIWETEKSGSIEVGVPWETIEFPCPAYYGEELSDDPDFKKEHDIYSNFACPLNKIGGHLLWVQSDNTPTDRDGKPMQYIGQFTATRDEDLGDGGIVYIFYSAETRETKAVLQYY